MTNSRSADELTESRFYDAQTVLKKKEKMYCKKKYKTWYKNPRSPGVRLISSSLVRRASERS